MSTIGVNHGKNQDPNGQVTQINSIFPKKTPNTTLRINTTEKGIEDISPLYQVKCYGNNSGSCRLRA